MRLEDTHKQKLVYTKQIFQQENRSFDEDQQKRPAIEFSHFITVCFAYVNNSIHLTFVSSRTYPTCSSPINLIFDKCVYYSIIYLTLCSIFYVIVNLGVNIDAKIISTSNAGCAVQIVIMYNWGSLVLSFDFCVQNDRNNKVRIVFIILLLIEVI